MINTDDVEYGEKPYLYTSHLRLRFHQQGYVQLCPELIRVNRGKGKCMTEDVPGRAMRTYMNREIRPISVGIDIVHTSFPVQNHSSDPNIEVFL